MTTNKRVCEDCGEDIPKGNRRFRCPHCLKLVCGWCWNHVHALSQVTEK